MNVHFQILVQDGVFALEGDGPARFVRLPAPRDEDVDAILRRIVRSVAKALVGYEEMESELDALIALQAAEAERRARFPDPFKHARLSAILDGFSLHAGVRIDGNDRAGLERLCRYVRRPPFALQRLSKGEDGWLVYPMKRPRGGSLFLVLTPDELLARLATLVPPPRVRGRSGLAGPLEEMAPLASCMPPPEDEEEEAIPGVLFAGRPKRSVPTRRSPRTTHWPRSRLPS